MTSRPAWALALLLAAPDVPAPVAPEQAAAAAPSTPDRDVTLLAQGWAALAAARADAAIRAADEVLVRRPGHHGALELKIDATAIGQPLEALDVYERWLGRVRIEDVFLLVPIARGTLEQIAAGQDPLLQAQALARLGAAGVANAQARLKRLVDEGPVSNTVQLAIEGNASAAARLLDPAVAATVQPQPLAQALAAGGAPAVPVLMALLTHPAGAVRAAAALSLSKIGATEAIPALKALLQNAESRSFAAVALTRLGDTESEPIVQQLLDSPVMDGRLLAAEAFDGKSSGRWVDALLPLLQDPNGVTRIRAAELLSTVAPQAARATLLQAAADPNPVVRSDVSRALDNPAVVAPAELMDPRIPSPGGSDTVSVALLRQLLRDANPGVRLHAAGAILKMTMPR